MIGMLDAPSLKNTKLGLETLEMMGHSGSKMKFVLNRADGGAGITRRDVEQILGVTPDIFVPEDREIDYLICKQCSTPGRSEIAQSLQGKIIGRIQLESGSRASAMAQALQLRRRDYE